MQKTNSDASSDIRHPAYGRGARMGLLGLLAVTGLFAAGALFVKFKLEEFRHAVQEEAISRIGVRLDAGKVQRNGLRGLRIDNFSATLRAPLGPDVSISVLEAYVDLDLADLLQGQMTIDRINVDKAEIEVRRGRKGEWFNPENTRIPEFTNKIAFRLTGRHCSLRVPGAINGVDLVIGDLNLDLARMPDAQDITVNLSGLLDGQPGREVTAKLRYASMEDFDLRLGSSPLSAAEINAYLPAQEHFVNTGSVEPKLQINGYPRKTLVFSVEMAFENLLFAGGPSGLRPATGSMTALANYGLDDHRLSLAAAKAESDQLSGQVEGSVDFSGPQPQFDLRLKADEFPAMDSFTYELPGHLEDFGDIAVNLDEPDNLSLLLQGTPDAPRIRAETRLPAGRFVFTPVSSRYPNAELELGQIVLSWDAASSTPRGSFNITGGTITHKSSGITGEEIQGKLLFDADQVVLEPLNAKLAGNPLVGSARYDMASGKLGFMVNGLLNAIEKTPWADKVDKLALAGAIGFNCQGSVEKGRTKIEANIDATQAWVEYDWWFSKPLGTGLGIRGITLDYVPRKSIQARAAAINVDTTVLHGGLSASYSGGKWSPGGIDATFEPFDAAAISKCLRIPYAIAGGICTNLTFNRSPIDGQPGADRIALSGNVDALTVRPKDKDLTLLAKDARFEVTMNNTPEGRTGQVLLTAASTEVPPLRLGWMESLRPPNPELDARFPRIPRTWNYDLKSETLDLAPWHAQDFTFLAMNDEGEIKISRFAGKVDQGTIEGAYHLERADNVSSMQARWDGIPATLLLKHLQFPELLTGTITGDIAYSVDQDDPGTLKGKGEFNIRDGQFSADYLTRRFEEQLSGDMATLPRSLKFSLFSAGVELDGDVIKTTDGRIEADELRILGEGSFVTGGDMDYTIKVALSPAAAARMPVLASNLNLEGHRIAQRDIELGFRITGPSFSPKAQVTGLPSVGDTIFSGAAEVGKEVGKVIDTPRQILMDLFRIMGGIVGTSK